MNRATTVHRVWQMWQWLVDYRQKNGFAPTVREAAEWLEATFGLSDSTSVARWHFELMEEWGWIERVGRAARAIRLLKTGSQVEADVRLMNKGTLLENANAESQPILKPAQPTGISFTLPDNATADAVIAMIRVLGKRPITFGDTRRIAEAVVNSPLRPALVEALGKVTGEPA